MRRREMLRTLAAMPAGGFRGTAAPLERGPAKFGDGRDWFFQKRLGLFVHWGLYAIPAWHEQHMYRMGWTRDQYRPLSQQFNPHRFDPNRWIDSAQAAGMEYLCFTAKHRRLLSLGYPRNQFQRHEHAVW